MSSSASSISCEESSDDGQCKGKSTSLKRGPWTAEEDEILAAYVTKKGEGNWTAVRKNTALSRCGKSCRLRWINHLRPSLKKGAFTIEEQCKIIQLHAQMGNKWARMAHEFPGRTDNEIKNFWNARRKKLKRAGLPLYPDDIKPVLNNTHNVPSQSYLNDDESQAGTSCEVPELVFNNYHLQISHQRPPLLCKPPISDQLSNMMPHYSSNNTAPVDNNYACSSSDPPSISELPPFSSIDYDTLRGEPRAAETNHQHYEAVSPRSNGYLESIFYPPKILEEGSDRCSKQGESNLENKEDSDQKNLVYDQDALGDFSWVDNNEKDEYDLNDTLFNIFLPHFPH